ncbi:hypothetical protein [Nocardioides sp. Root140]|uniref:hypothetical protein n=1 Tax=Nocardioides sp. Root140 TaxID=1736460 RepID=UPI0012E336C6|nr:hypothetical protein [Nocardioides sp. Root140]
MLQRVAELGQEGTRGLVALEDGVHRVVVDHHTQRGQQRGHRLDVGGQPARRLRPVGHRAAVVLEHLLGGAHRVDDGPAFTGGASHQAELHQLLARGRQGLGRHAQRLGHAVVGPVAVLSGKSVEADREVVG